MKYKIGEYVTIKSEGFLRNELHYSPGIVPTMYQYAGRICQVKEITPSGFYKLDEKDIDRFLWHEKWLDPAVTLKINAKALEDLLNG